jgi:hypothetical protein
LWTFCYDGKEEIIAPVQERIAMLQWGKVLLVSIFFYALGCSMAETQNQNRATQAENRQLYNIYQQYMQSQNEQRAKSGVPPQPIKPYEEWRQSPGTD